MEKIKDNIYRFSNSCICILNSNLEFIVKPTILKENDSLIINIKDEYILIIKDNLDELFNELKKYNINYDEEDNEDNSTL